MECRRRAVERLQTGRNHRSSFLDFLSQEDIRARKPERELEIALADGRVEDEGWRLRKDGSRFWANVVLQIIERNVKSQTQLVDDLLNVSRIVTGNLKIAPQWIDPMSVIHAAVESIVPLRWRKIGYQAHIAKPVTIPDLVSILSRVARQGF